MSDTKHCGGCGKTKPVSEFSKATAKKDGYKSQCKACNKQYYEANKVAGLAKQKEYREANRAALAARAKQYRKGNKVAIVAQKKEYYEANKAAIAAKNKEYYEANKVEALVQRKEYYKANKVTIAAKNKEYREANRAALAANQKECYEANKVARAARMKEYRKANKDKYNSYRAKRRALKLQATPVWSDLEAISEFYTCALAFKVYTGREYHVDHIVPLQSKLVCGLHVPANLQLLEASENISKGNRYWPDMP